MKINQLTGKYVTLDDHGNQVLSKDAPKNVVEKFWKYRADSADGFRIDWVKNNIPSEYAFMIKNRQKFSW